MTQPEEYGSRISGMDVWMAVAALAGALLLIFAATQSQAQTFTVLHSFSFTGLEGAVPFAGVTLDAAGRIYGTTYQGGANSQGIVYRLSHSGAGWTESVLYSFGDSDGGGVMSRVLFGPDGALYGTTPFGGASGAGTVFRLTPPPNVCQAITCPWTKTVLYSFTGGSDGAGPQDDLLFDAVGNIYGNAERGGVNGNGVIFKLTRSGSTWTESVLYSFTGGADGCQPLGGPIFDNAGNIYGTTLGNFCGRGTVYKLTPSQSGWTETTLYTFTDQDLGFAVGLTIDAHNNLFGLTGRQGGGGVAYELSPVNGNWFYSRLAILPQGGEGPYDAPTLDAQGNLYGTSCCTPEDGAVFKLTPSGLRWNYTSLYVFTGGSDGATPTGGVTFDSSGNLYGTASAAGQGAGTVWEITP